LKPDLKVVTLQESNFRDPVATLRKIADNIEAGEYGDVGTVALVLLGDTMEVFGLGRDSEATSVSLLLNAGLLRLARTVERRGQ
jgi:hypothetical protein